MYRLSIRCLTTIVLAGVVVTTLTLSSSAQRVSPVTASLNVAAMPPSARFEVTLCFFVNQETYDDVLERDGKRDEVSFSRVAILHNIRTGSRFFSEGLNFTQAMGESPPNSSRAGRAPGGRGGLQTGGDVVLPYWVLFSANLSRMRARRP
jgi:hypothetical protein